jgi:molybdopterin molybdotransferase
LLDALVQPVIETQVLPLMQALGRVLARDVIAPMNVPAHDNSAMDGYAFNGAILAEAGAVVGAGAALEFNVTGVALAGHPIKGVIAPGCCARVMTGALIPAGTDTVVPYEYAKVLTPPDALVPRVALSIFTGGTTDSTAGGTSGAATRTTIFKRGANRRLAGEDLAKGQVVLQQGSILTAAHLGLLASLGIGTIEVRRQLRVAYFSTGDELRGIGETLEPGCVYDSNRYTLHAMLLRMGVEPVDLGVVKDDPQALSETLRRASEQADAIISSGGVSAGDADFVRDVFTALGDVVFWKLAMRPGRPFAFGRLRTGSGRAVPFFGLPGNPVAVMATFYNIVRGALLTLMGASKEAVQPVPRVKAFAAVLLKKRPGRTEFARGLARRDTQGDWQVSLAGAQGSGVLSSMSEANCFIVLEHERGDVGAGETVDIVFFEGLI